MNKSRYIIHLCVPVRLKVSTFCARLAGCAHFFEGGSSPCGVPYACSRERSLPHTPLHPNTKINKQTQQKHSPSHAPHDPIDHQQRPRPRADLLAPIHAPPRIHRHQAAHEAPAPEVEHRRVPDVRERAEVEVPEGRRDGLVGAGAAREVVRVEHRALAREL